MNRLYKDVISQIVRYIPLYDYIQIMRLNKEFYEIVQQIINATGLDIFEDICHNCKIYRPYPRVAFYLAFTWRDISGIEQIIAAKVGCKATQCIHQPIICHECNMRLTYNNNNNNTIMSMPFISYSHTIKVFYKYYPKKNIYVYDCIISL
jgi:hypothetical protein